MTVYTVTQQGDSELAVELTEAADIVTLNVTGATIQAEVTSVNGETGVVVLDTDSVDEGSTNLYYTDGRFDTRLATKDTGDLSEGTNLYYTDARSNAAFDTRLATKDTGDLTEGTNLYYTDGRFDARLATKDTDNLTEGASNLYYTDARANTAIDARVTGTFIEGLDYTLDGGTY